MDVADAKRLTNAGARKIMAKASAKNKSTMATAYAGICDDFQLKTAYDQLKAWNIFARPAGAGIPGDRTAGR